MIELPVSMKREGTSLKVQTLFQVWTPVQEKVRKIEEWMAASRKRQLEAGVYRRRGRGRVTKVGKYSPKGKRVTQTGIKRLLINKNSNTGPIIGVLNETVMVDGHNPSNGTIKVEGEKPYRKEGRGRVCGTLRR